MIRRDDGRWKHKVSVSLALNLSDQISILHEWRLYQIKVSNDRNSTPHSIGSGLIGAVQWQWPSVLAQWSKFFLEARMRMSSLLSMLRPSGGVIRHSALAVKLITWSGCRPLTTRPQPSPARRGATQPGHRTKRPAAASILPHRLFPHFPAAAPSAVERMDRLDDVQWNSVTWDYVEKCYQKGWLECYCDCGEIVKCKVV